MLDDGDQVRRRPTEDGEDCDHDQALAYGSEKGRDVEG
jgi:hypothetical protein